MTGGLAKNKKRIIAIISGVVALTAVSVIGSGLYLRSTANANTKYNEEEAKEIALTQYPGEVIKLKKDYELDFTESKVEYEITIRTNDSKLVEVIIDGSYGGIVDADGRDDINNTSNNKNAGNINTNSSDLKVSYTEEDAKEIALARYPGAIKTIYSDIDSDDNEVEYDIIIETNDNKIIELTVDGTTGNISDVDIEENNRGEVRVNYTEEQVKEIALAKYPGTIKTIYKDIDLDDNKVEYDIIVNTDDNKIVELTIDGATGNISDIDIEENTIGTVIVNYTEEQAKEIALTEHPGTVIEVKQDIDSDDNKIEYDIKINTNHNRIVEVTIDATSGRITEVDFE